MKRRSLLYNKRRLRYVLSLCWLMHHRLHNVDTFLAMHSRNAMQVIYFSLTLRSRNALDSLDLLIKNIWTCIDADVYYATAYATEGRYMWRTGLCSAAHFLIRWDPVRTLS